MCNWTFGLGSRIRFQSDASFQQRAPAPQRAAFSIGLVECPNAWWWLALPTTSDPREGKVETTCLLRQPPKSHIISAISSWLSKSALLKEETPQGDEYEEEMETGY